MLETLAELIAAILDIFLSGSESIKRRNSQIDKIVKKWKPRYDITEQYTYKDEKSRSFILVDDSGYPYEICIKILKWWRVKITANNSEQKRKQKFWKKKTKISKLSLALDEAYATIEKWINESGRTRTIKK